MGKWESQTTPLMRSLLQIRSAIDYRSDAEEEDVDILEKQPAYKKKVSYFEIYIILRYAHSSHQIWTFFFYFTHIYLQIET